LLELGELRWILLGIGIVAIAAIWWWTVRRSRQAPGNAELREPTMMPPSSPPMLGEAVPERRGAEPRPEGRAGEPRLETRAAELRLAMPLEPRAGAHAGTRAAADERPRDSAPGWRTAEEARAPASLSDSHERGPVEPPSIRTGDFADVPALDQPILIDADPIDFSLDSSRATGAPRFAPARQDASAPPSAPDEEGDANATTVRTAGVQLPLAVPPASPTPIVPAIGSPPTLSPDTASPPVVTTPAAAALAAPPQAPAPAPLAATTARWRPASEHSDRYSSTGPQAVNSAEKQKIVALRVCAVGEERWTGAALIGALEMHGLAFGRYQVFHRRHSDGRSIFCVASLVEPGTFDLSSMPNELYRGISLFAVLPGPIDPVQTIEAMLATARELARELSGTMQDAKGMPFSPQRAEALLKDVSRFQALLA
jgi:cell division protein ZipA